MKKRRRIEITAFRRRTTIIVRDRPEGNSIEQPPLHGETTHPSPADSPQAEGDEINPSGHAASAGQPESLGDLKETASEKQVGRLS